MMSRNSSNAGRALWWWVGSGFAGAGAILAVATILGFVAAVLGASLSCKAAEPSGPVATNGPAPSAAALQDIPPERLRIYEQAGARFDIDWTFLASIGAQEYRNGVVQHPRRRLSPGWKRVDRTRACLGCSASACVRAPKPAHHVAKPCKCAAFEAVRSPRRPGWYCSDQSHDDLLVAYACGNDPLEGVPWRRQRSCRSMART